MFGHLWPLAMAAAQQPQPQPSCDGSQLLLPAVLLAIMYFVWLRPAQMDRKKHENLLKSLKRGDEVLTNSGIFGTIADIQEKTLMLEIARNVKIKVLRSTVLRKVGPEAETEDKSKSDNKSKSGSKDK
jgi:preprotein translocase subunit YajC